MDTDELLATCWTTAGDTAPDRDDQRSPLSLRERVEAASAAGFSGIGLLYADLVEAEREYGLAGIRSLLEDNGLVHVELEFLTDWWTDGPRRTASDAVRGDLLKAAEALGARHLKVGPDVEDQPWNLDIWAAEFAILAAQADGAGARLGIEFLPWSNIKTVHDGLRLVEAAGHPAGGLIIDVWHTERAHTPPAELALVPRSRIVGVELSDADGTVVGTLFEDTVRRRRLCGQGSFALPDIITALRAAGWSGPWGVEILSDTHRTLPVREAAAEAYRSAAALLK
ncbi:sugar phosphate isomerase/epimerase family protein [Streptomyces sp. NPDC048288]|uniref:sugar phosphate isomerase/epimerase family protein n=1 Tax=Streptomyces sp. NPDC048288 TaxID=3365529 RepID=UPI00371503DF